jgi:hypothetical protein
MASGRSGRRSDVSAAWSVRPSASEHLGLPTAAPVLAPARSPPEFEFAG